MIEAKIIEETKALKDLCERLTCSLSNEVNGGIENLDAAEATAAADMIKDIAIAKEKTVKALYYCEILKAMEKTDYGEDYDEDGPKYYRGRSSTTGRYMHRPYTEDNRMYYTRVGMDGDEDNSYTKAYEEGRNRGYEEGHTKGFTEGMHTATPHRYESALRGYEQAKEVSKSGNEQDREHKMQSLNSYLAVISEDLSNKVMDMDQQERNTLRNKLQAIERKIP